MLFLPARPSARLAAHVDFLWCAEASAAAPGAGTQFPQGGVTLLFNLAEPQGLLDSPGGRCTWFRTAWVCGELQRPLHLLSPRGTSVVGVRFRPGGARAFLGVALEELADRILPLDAFWPETELVRERLAAAVDHGARFAVLEDVLQERLRHHARFADGWMVHAVSSLGIGAAGSTVASFAEALGMTPRHLRRLFAEHVGVGPKALQRVLRFQRVIGALDAGTHTPWVRLAADCGYFDQAHLIRDFRAFTDMTPSAYADARSPDPNFAHSS